jgi:cobalt transporter subunit CbtA
LFQRVFFSAIAAGLLAGVLISVVQSVTTTPIILHAEEFEGAGHDHGALTPPGPVLQPALFSGSPVARIYQVAESADAGEDEIWSPTNGIERALFTTLANSLVGVGFALLIVAGFVISNAKVTVGAGILWGAAGFVVFTLAPGLGLPPEVPGAFTADLGARQIWWVSAVAGAALGLGLMVFAAKLPLKVLGAVVMVVPHVVGAPHPEDIGGSVPPEIAGQFVAASIVVSAIFWVMLGGLSATLYRRLG